MAYPTTAPGQAVMVHHTDPDQFSLIDSQPPPTTEATRTTPRRRRKPRHAATPAAAQEVLTEVQEGRYGALDDTDRIVWFTDPERVRHAHDEEIVAGLIRQRYVERCPARDTITAHHGAIRRPVSPLRLTKEGRALLTRWSALADY
ncbi:hypothetical protein [Amycolatopsis pithecellobii]|uniref:Uncharacterized protein n=1 Tax=Amycolatopsis pithecellobii TaxID=664692 RepID=A0A6N7YYB0_9PSEU|nr:hypothetical protein [Amycolatopsis pithecellobii]MTD53883.1 hypothetical protein [Amycolatopsis pithecellobii]